MRKLRLAAFAAVSVSAIAAVYLTVGARGAFVAALMLVCYFKRQTILPLALVACWAFMSRALGFLTAHTPHTLDATLWRLDLRLGYSPAVAMAAVGSSPSLLWITTHAYWEGLLGAVVVAALAGPRPWEFIAKGLAASVAGYGIFWLVPACGPGFFLSGQTNTPRNAMPSLHLVWALMIARRARGNGLAGRVAADIFLVLTIVATLGLGEHYLVDLIAAVPFWAALEALWRYLPVRGFGNQSVFAVRAGTPPPEQGSV